VAGVSIFRRKKKMEDTSQVVDKEVGVEVPSKRGRPASGGGEGRAARRPARVPMGARNVLNAPERPGYVRYWFNDVNNQIQEAMAAWWEPVKKEDMQIGDPRTGTHSQLGEVVMRVVGSHDGQPIRAVLMEIPNEYYEEDMARQQAKVDEIENALRRKVKQEGHYGEVKIDQKGPGLRIATY